MRAAPIPGVIIGITIKYGELWSGMRTGSDEDENLIRAKRSGTISAVRGSSDQVKHSQVLMEKID